MGAISANLVTETEYFKMKPDRIIAGLMTVVVSHAPLSGESELECNYAYAKHWDAGSDVPNDVPNDDDYPYGDLTAGAPEPLYQKDTLDADFENTRKISAYFESGGTWGTSETTVEKNLSLGDYDTYLFFVTGGVHGEAPYYTTSSGTPDVVTGTSGLTYYNISDFTLGHNGCQSFIKSHLISRINNAFNCVNTDTAGYSLYGTPITQRDYTFPASGSDTNNQMQNLTKGETYLFSNGRYVHPSPGFGLNLSNDSATGVTDRNNTFFTPVHSIDITVEHTGPTSTPTIRGDDSDIGGSASDYYFKGRNMSHDINDWKVKVDVNFLAYNVSGTTNKSYFHNRVNIFFQPFGETSELILTS